MYSNHYVQRAVEQIEKKMVQPVQQKLATIWSDDIPTAVVDSGWVYHIDRNPATSGLDVDALAAKTARSFKDVRLVDER